MQEQKLTGYPSIDKPWLKYYSKEAVNTSLPECTIYEYLWENNRNHIEDVALNYFGRQITYGELFENIEKAAKAFSALGVKAGDIIVLTTVTTPEMIYSFYALNRLGAISNMVDLRTSTEGIKNYILEVDAKLVLTLDVALPKIEKAILGTNVQRIVVISPADSLPQPKKALFLLSGILKGKSLKLSEHCIAWTDFVNQGNGVVPVCSSYKKDTCCVIVHTGGTTGAPKGVMLSNENLNASVVQCDLSGFIFRRKHKWLGVMPPFIAYGISNGLHLPLCKGMVLIVLPKFDPAKYDRLLLKYKPNHIAGVPSHYNTIIHSRKMKNRDLSFLFSPIVGGDGTEIGFECDVSRFLHSHNCSSGLIKGYGMTEICAAVCATARKEYNKTGCVGVPFTHSVVSVFDPNSGEELAYNQEGEICMIGPNIMLGYYGNSDETHRIIKKHSDGRLWLHSGDLGRMDEDGCIYIKGRLKRMIVRHDGFKVFPSVIEDVINKCSYVSACCVVGVPDKSNYQGQLPFAFVVLNKNCNEATVKTDLYKLCQNELPEYAQPVDLILVDALPLTPIGKIDYRVLERQAEESSKRK